MRIVTIVGGTSDPSNSETLARAFNEGLKAAGAETEIITLRDKTIDPFTLRCYAPDFQPEEDFKAIQSAIERADGLVIASPVWNFGIPANLKNVIDRCGAFGLDRETRTKGQWKDKPFYLIFTGGAPAAAWTGLFRRTTSAVPVALQYFGGAQIGTHFEPRCMIDKGVFGHVVDKRPASLAAMKAKGESFARIVKSHAETGALPLTVTFMRKFYALGQWVQKKFL